MGEKETVLLLSRTLDLQGFVGANWLAISNEIRWISGTKAKKDKHAPCRFCHPCNWDRDTSNRNGRMTGTSLPTAFHFFKSNKY